MIAENVDINLRVLQDRLANLRERSTPKGIPAEGGQIFKFGK